MSQGLLLGNVMSACLLYGLKLRRGKGPWNCTARKTKTLKQELLLDVRFTHSNQLVIFHPFFDFQRSCSGKQCCFSESWGFPGYPFSTARSWQCRGLLCVHENFRSVTVGVVSCRSGLMQLGTLTADQLRGIWRNSNFNIKEVIIVNMRIIGGEMLFFPYRRCFAALQRNTGSGLNLMCIKKKK